MPGLRAEFTLEPFTEGRPGPHVQAAIDALRSAGLEVEFGPFGSAIRGSDTEVIDGIAAMMRSTLEAGATRIALQIERASDQPL